jgi:hypothetical protein
MVATVFRLIPFILIPFIIEKILLRPSSLSLTLVGNDKKHHQGVHVDVPVKRAIG